MKKSYTSLGSICRLSTLLLIVLVVVGSACKNQVDGASLPWEGVDTEQLYKLFNRTINNQDTKEKEKPGHTTNKRHHLLYHIWTERFVQLLRTGRKGVRAKGKKGKNMEFSQLWFVSTPRNTIVIRNVRSDLYICFTRRGKVVARRKKKAHGCEFEELYSADGQYSQFVSASAQQRHSWYLGFNEKGKPVKGSSKSSLPEECFNFLKIDEENKQCVSGNGPIGVNFCDKNVLGTILTKTKNSKPLKTKRRNRNKLRHSRHHRRRRKG